MLNPESDVRKWDSRVSVLGVDFHLQIWKPCLLIFFFKRVNFLTFFLCWEGTERFFIAGNLRDNGRTVHLDVYPLCNP